MRILLPALLLVLAGCLAPGGEEEATYRLSGSFGEGVTEAQIRELGAEVERHGGSMLVAESYPPQFQANGLDRDGCEKVRASASDKPYVRTVGTCHPARPPSEGDTATSSHRNDAGADAPFK